MLKWVRSTYYWTKDMEGSVAFYRDVLGLEPSARHGDGWAEFDVGGSTLALHGEIDGVPMVDGATVIIEVDDLDATMRTLAERGVGFEGEVRDTGGGRFASFRDPHGNLLQLFQARAREGGS